jgi:purine-cytosine permease-like protein
MKTYLTHLKHHLKYIFYNFIIKYIFVISHYFLTKRSQSQNSWKKELSSAEIDSKLQ